MGKRYPWNEELGMYGTLGCTDDICTADSVVAAEDFDALEGQVAAEHALVVQLFTHIREARRILNVIGGLSRVSMEAHGHIAQFLHATDQFDSQSDAEAKP